MQALRFQLNPMQHLMLQIQILRGLYEQLKQQGVEIPESLQAMLLLAVLPSQWQTSLVSTAMNKATLTDNHNLGTLGNDADSKDHSERYRRHLISCQ